VVRAANRGTSAWILSSGAVAARGGDFRAEIARAHAAPAVQLGPFWLAACALVTGALVIGGALRR
jgi:apolipoprotein N-acyltransferase